MHPVLEELSKLPCNWDSYGASPPNATALHWAEVILNLLTEANIAFSKITPSVESGIGISFISKDRYADIECFNTGEIAAVLSDGQGNINTWEVGKDTPSIKFALDKIHAFMENSNVHV